jgi:hypothetical protein
MNFNNSSLRKQLTNMGQSFPLRRSRSHANKNELVLRLDFQIPSNFKSCPVTLYTDHDQVVPMSADVTNARGNAVCSKVEALPYSTDALALLVLESEDTPVDQRGRALISTLRI